MMQNNKRLVISFLSIVGIVLAGLVFWELNSIDIELESLRERLFFIKFLLAISVLIHFFTLISIRMQNKWTLEHEIAKKNRDNIDSKEGELFTNDNLKNKLEEEVGVRDSKFGQKLEKLYDQKYDSLEVLCNNFLTVLCSHFEFAQGIVFVKKPDTEEFFIQGTYAYYSENTDYSFKKGEGISGQVAKNKKAILLSNIPDDYINVVSGLGSSIPKYLMVIPVVLDGDSLAVVELASFSEMRMNDIGESVIKQFAKTIKGFL